MFQLIKLAWLKYIMECVAQWLHTRSLCPVLNSRGQSNILSCLDIRLLIPYEYEDVLANTLGQNALNFVLISTL